MAQVPHTEVFVDGDGVTTIFDFDFPYQDKDEVFVSVNGVDTPYVWLAGSEYSLQVTPAPVLGAKLRIYRSTMAYVPLHVFDAGVPFLPRYVDENNRQLLYVAQEAINSTAGTASQALVVAEEARDTAQRAEDKVDGVLIDSAYQLRQDLTAPEGAGLVGHSPTVSYPATTVGHTLNTILKRAVFIEPLGGSLNDSANINAKAADVGARGDLFFSGGTFNINKTVTVPENQAWKGTGGQRGTTFLKTANCDMVVVLSLGAISDINLQGAGATYSGKGIRIPSGFSQSIERCRSADMGGEPLYFDNNAGGGANVSTFEGYPTDPTAFAGIAVAGDTGPHPRFFRGIWLSGANFALGPGAGNGGSMIGFYIRNLKLDPGSTLFHFGMGRVAAMNDDIPLRGFDHTFDGVAFSGKVILRNAQGINCGSSCTISELVQESTAQYNSVFVQRRSYPVLWTQTSATPAIGNGSLVGNFVRAGHLCTVEVSLTSGSTTTFGDSASAWQFSLPFQSHPSIDQRGFPVRIYDASGAIDFTAWASIGANSQVMTLTVGSQSVRAGQPMAWASGDLLQASFSYMVR